MFSFFGVIQVMSCEVSVVRSSGRFSVVIFYQWNL